MKKKRKKGKLNNLGVTMAELIVTFALLGIFMVAATRVIAYTIGIYYVVRGSTYGLEVSDMVSKKIVGQLEGAKQVIPEVTKGTDIDEIAFTDATGSKVVISALSKPGTTDAYINIHYKEVTEGSIAYDAVDWTFDPKAYMGYTVKRLVFENPDADPSVDDYPDNVVKMTLVLTSDRYGDYRSIYYIKCGNVEKIHY